MKRTGISDIRRGSTKRRSKITATVALAGVSLISFIGVQVTSQQVAGAATNQTTLGSGFSYPFGVAADSSGHVFVADTYNNQIVEMNADGSNQTTLGSGFWYPSGVAVDSSGHIFVADTFNSRVVAMNADGTNQTTVATGFDNPTGVAVDSSGHVFVADSGNGQIVEMNADGTNQTIIGSGFNGPKGVAVDSSGNIFVADTYNNQIVELMAPGAPSSVTASGGNSAATVSWSAADANGSDITGYTVSDGSGHTCTTATTSCTVTDLTNGQAYTFTVVATNAIGNGSASDASNSVTPGVASVATGVTATAGDTSASVSWTAADANGADITGYTISDGSGHTCTTATTSCTVTGLTNGQAYTFTVVATNANGNGSASDASNSVTPSGLPGVATSVTATASDTTATVSWSAADANGSDITGYTVSDGSGHTCTTATTSCTVTGLTNGQAYTFTVVATNTNGDGSASDASNSVTPGVAGVPGVATGVTATAGDTSASVSWTAASANGSDITGYTVNDGSGHTCTTATTSCTVTGLTNGDSYTFTVVATNANGDSSASDASNSVTPSGLPGVATSVTASAGDTSASVSWTAAEANGSDITGYTISDGSGHTCTTATTSCTVTDLTNGQAYTFTVVATNANGDSLPSDASVAVVPSTVPDAPTDVVATPGDQSASVSWSAPTSTSDSPITGYTVTATDSTTPGNGNQSVSGSTSPIAVTGLTNGDSYSFTVVATNAVGSSTTSSSSSNVTPSTVPGVPGSQTIIGSGFNRPVGVAVDTSGNVYVGEPFLNRVEKITPAGVQTTIGSGFHFPLDVAVDSSGHVFVADTVNNQIVEMNADGSNQTTIGSGFYFPEGVAVDTSGNVYVADVGHLRVVEITPAGVQTTIGSGFNSPYDVAVDSSGNVYVAYTDNNRVEKITPAGVQTTIGSGFDQPLGVAVDSSGNVYVADVGHNRVEKITPAGVQTTIASGFSVPSGVAVDTSGNVYVTDFTRGQIVSLGFVSATSESGSASVSFSAPISGGSIITGYTVTATDLTNGGRGAQTQSGTTSPLVVTGLTNGDSYTFTVVATNANGDSLPSVPSGAVVPSTVPDAPTGVVATLGDQSASVTWSAPAFTGGSTVTGYTVTSNDGHACTGSDPGDTCTITGLTSGTSYTFTVVATNANGDSPASGASNSVTPSGVPGVATGVTATAGNTTASVSWTAPSGGALVTSYLVTSSISGKTCTTNGATSCTVTGLTNGTTYTFTVVATNASGNSEAATSNSVTPSSNSAVITSASSINIAAGKNVNFTVTTSGSPTATVSATGVPSWATFTPGTKSKAGTATVKGAAPIVGGTFTMTIHANNGVGPDATQVLTVHALAFTSAATATFSKGTSGSFTITTTDSAAALSTTLSAAKQAGLTFTDNHDGTATLSGTPGSKDKTATITVSAMVGSVTVKQKLSVAIG